MLQIFRIAYAEGGKQMNGLYTIKELTQSIIDEYQLDCSTDSAFEVYYMRIYRALQKKQLLKAGIEKINPETKRKCMYYTEQHKQAILCEKTLYDYVRSNSTSEEIKNRKRYNELQKDIEVRREAHIKYLDSQTQDDENSIAPTITDQEFQDYKNTLMLTALFERIFTPINDDLLYNDLYQTQIIKDELNLQAADIEAEERLQHPNGSYYHEKIE